MGPWFVALMALTGAAEPEPGRARAGLTVAEVDGVTPLEAAVLVDALAAAIEEVAQAEVLIMGTDAAPCLVASTRCTRVIPDIVEARVSVRVFGGLSLVRIDATVTASRIASARGSADVARDPAAARAGLATLAQTLFPSRLVSLAAPTQVEDSADQVIDVSVTPPPPEPRSLQWLLVGAGAGAALGAVGIAFGVSSASARSAAETPGVDAARFESLADRAQAHGWAANVFLVSAALGLAAGVLLYSVEP